MARIKLIAMVLDPFSESIRRNSPRNRPGFRVVKTRIP
jgi:hypothetical protein